MISRFLAARLVALILAAAGVLSIAGPNAAEASCLPASLSSTLNQIRSKFGPVSIVSTHRPGARIAGSGRKSYHASCRAVDFNAPKGKYKEVVAWLQANHSGGLGTYSCGMHHIHIDNGPHVRFHKCQGSGGKVYASSRGKSKHYASKSGGSKKKYAAKSSTNKTAYAPTTKATSANVKVAAKSGGSPWKMTSYAH